jgi:glutathione peroxidase
MNIFEFVTISISGAPLRFANWTGQPILLCNTASECGYTPQYRGLQRLWEDYRHSGLMVIGMPCNDFGEQEPGDEEAIFKFVTEEYDVTFPMTSKQSVMGLSAHPLFQAMRDEFGDDVTPRWNFHKYLFSKQGDLVEFWPSSVEPNDPVISHQIERNLQSWIL